MEKQNSLNIKRKSFNFILIYVAVMLVFYLIAGQQLKYKAGGIKNSTINSTAGTLQQGTIITQTFHSDLNEIDSATFNFATYHRKNQGAVAIKLLDSKTKRVLAQRCIDVSTFEEDKKIDVLQGRKITGVKDRELELQFSSDSRKDQCVTLYMDNALKNADQKLVINGMNIPGALSMEITGRNTVPFTRNFLIFSLSLLVVVILYCVNLIYKEKHRQKSVTLNVIRASYLYRFLLHQLVSRDFKTKYKRSVLGIFWSFLNPMLTMLVQYIIFSTIFKQDIPNFPAYLIIGVVFFNFFNESSSMGLSSIIDNSQLITKVYIPKYIFPISRVMSSCVNMLLSFVPMFAIIFITGIPIKPVLLLLPYSILCTVAFSLGASLFLSSAMVFFRDMQFIWGVVSMLWMYATPIFYPETIIPQQFQIILKLNPMYHFIRFSRTVILDGISPDPQAYLFCFLGAVIPLVIGALLFKKTQDKFILYI